LLSLWRCRRYLRSRFCPWPRRSRGLPELAADDGLARAADHKSADILRCDEFSHEACGREFTHWIERFGFHGCAAAENIAWGGGSLEGNGGARVWTQDFGGGGC
jgi:hypothetical protein